MLAAEPDKLAEYRAGRDKLFGFFVGAVMKAMGGKANPKVINDLLRAKLAALNERVRGLGLIRYNFSGDSDHNE